MVNEKQRKIKDQSDGVPVLVEDAAAVELRGGALLTRPVLRHAMGLALAAALTACGDLGGGAENICTPCWKRGLMCKYEVKATLSGAPYYQVSCLKVDTTYEVPMSEAPELAAPQ